jgi:hypothetical protein
VQAEIKKEKLENAKARGENEVEKRKMVNHY